MYVYRRKAQYHETDRMGIIHHANYVKWMEEARMNLLDQLGMGYKQMEELYRLSSEGGISMTKRGRRHKRICAWRDSNARPLP